MTPFALLAALALVADPAVPAAGAGGGRQEAAAIVRGGLAGASVEGLSAGRRLALLTQAAERMKLTARGYHRVLKVARTLADLEGGETVRRLHIAEALSYTNPDINPKLITGIAVPFVLGLTAFGVWRMRKHIEKENPPADRD